MEKSEKPNDLLTEKYEELEIEGFSYNPKNRCYLCKRELFEKIRALDLIM